MDNKAKIVKLVSLRPGIHLRELQRVLGLSFNSVRYNAERLSESGEIYCEKTKGFARLYPSGTPEQDRIIYSLIQNKTTKKLLEELTKEPALTNKELTERTGLAKSTVSEHVHALMKPQLVRMILSEEGNFKVELQEQERVKNILVKDREISLNKDIVANFADLWDF